VTAAQKPEAQAVAWRYPDGKPYTLTWAGTDEARVLEVTAQRGLLRTELVSRAQLDEAVAAERALWQADAERYRWLEKNANQKTAHDLYGNGALWVIGIHSDDSNESLRAAIDAAIRRTTQDTPT